MRRLLIFLVAVLVIAQAEPAMADNAAEARAAFNRAKVHFKAKNFREALVELNTAYKLKPHPSLLRYIGDTYYKMNKARQAIKTYKKYLKLAPMAADKEKIEAKVRQLELIVGAGDDDDDDDVRPAPPPPPPPPRASVTTPRKPAKRIDMRPTGEDTEDPLYAGHKPGVTPRRRSRRAVPSRRGGQRGGQRDDGGGSGLTVAKWTILGAGVAGIALGVVFNRLAASDASELEDSVKTGCPPNNPGCTGNPEMNRPVVSYSKQHHDLMQGYQTSQSVSIATFITGGVLIGTSVVLFVLDRPAKKKRRGRASVNPMTITPVVTGEVFGLTGELRF